MSRRARTLLGAAIACLLALGIMGMLVVGDDDARSNAFAPCAEELNAVEHGRSETGALLACLTPSLVFIETPFATGSGVIIDDGYIVTNLHVVDPMTEVDVTLAGGRTVEGVSVNGVDPMTDIALLGPIDTTAHAFFGDAGALRSGDDVYLAGFPGEVDDDPQPAISKGIVSRVREAKEFDQTYLQTDAAIGSGQSGGALIDAAGRVVGISGLSFAENFALALSTADVQDSIRAIQAGESPSYRGFPEEPKSTSGTFTLDDNEDVEFFLTRTRDSAQQIQLTLAPSARPFISVDSFDGTPIFLTREAIDAIAEASATPTEILLDEMQTFSDFELGQAVSPGVFEFEVPKETFAMISVGTSLTDPVEIAYSSTVPLVHYQDTDQHTPIAVGDRLEGVTETLEESDLFVVDLAAGEEIEIYVGSGPGDMGYYVQGPGEKASDADFVDDSDVGLGGFDAKDVYKAGSAGQHRIFVYCNDFTTTGYVLKVSKPPPKARDGGKTKDASG